MEVEFYGKGEPLLEAMFGACVRWAWRDPAMREAFERETGAALAKNPLGALIDEATGYDHVVVEKFITWVAENVWGEAE